MNEGKREKHITKMLLIRTPNINQSEAHCFSFMGWLEGLAVNRFGFQIISLAFSQVSPLLSNVLSPLVFIIHVERLPNNFLKPICSSRNLSCINLFYLAISEFRSLKHSPSVTRVSTFQYTSSRMHQMQIWRTVRSAWVKLYQSEAKQPFSIDELRGSTVLSSFAYGETNHLSWGQYPVAIFS